MRRLWSSPAALHSTLLLPSIPLGQGCSTDTICARKTTFGKRMGREVLSQNIYIRTAPVEKAVFLRKLPLYFTGWTIKLGSTPLWSYSHMGKRQMQFFNCSSTKWYSHGGCRGFKGISTVLPQYPFIALIKYSSLPDDILESILILLGGGGGGWEVQEQSKLWHKHLACKQTVYMTHGITDTKT